MNKDYIDNDYRSAPSERGPAHDPSAIKRLDLDHDAVSVVHSGESDPMPNREAQDAYDDRSTLSAASPVNPTDSGSTPKEDDDNDFETQQHLAEDAGPETADEEDEESAA